MATMTLPAIQVTPPTMDEYTSQAIDRIVDLDEIIPELQFDLEQSQAECRNDAIGQDGKFWTWDHEMEQWMANDQEATDRVHEVEEQQMELDALQMEHCNLLQSLPFIQEEDQILSECLRRWCQMYHEYMYCNPGAPYNLYTFITAYQQWQWEAWNQSANPATNSGDVVLQIESEFTVVDPADLVPATDETAEQIEATETAKPEQIKKKPQITCVHAIRGRCRFGKKCRNAHINPDHCKKYLQGHGDECGAVEDPETKATRSACGKEHPNICTKNLKGKCPFGDECHYSHTDPSICRHWQFGKCDLGDKCHYDHPECLKGRAKGLNKPKASTPTSPEIDTQIEDEFHALE